MTMPYRPVCVDLFSGLTRHKHAYHACWSVIMLNVIVGAANSVGGLIGFDPACNGITDDPENVVQFRPSIWEEDGFMERRFAAHGLSRLVLRARAQAD